MKMSPLRSVLGTTISDVKESTNRYYKRKTNESVDSFLVLIAPKQGQQNLKEYVLNAKCCTQMHRDNEADDISTCTKLYMTLCTFFKTQILSVVSIKRTKVETQSLVPGITIYRIDQARKQLNTSSKRGFHIRE